MYFLFFIHNNCNKQVFFKVQLASIDLLIVLVSELILVVKDNGKAYATYINDLFLRCKGADHVISTGRQMTNLVSNFEYLSLLCFLTMDEF